MPVHYEVENKIARIVLEGRSVGNMFSPELIYRPLTAVLDRYTQDDEAWVAIVSVPEDRKAFTYGGDIKGIVAASHKDAENSSGYPVHGQRFNTYRTPHSGVISGPGMMDVPKPIIFAVRDRCLGAGMLVLLTLADIIVCAEGTIFGFPESASVAGLKEGILTRQLPWRIALEVILTHRDFSGEEALEWGLVNRVVPREDLMTTAEEIAGLILKAPPRAIQASKELAIAAKDVPLATTILQARLYTQILEGTPDAYEYFRSFAEKREPEYTGEWT